MSGVRSSSPALSSRPLPIAVSRTRSRAGRAVQTLLRLGTHHAGSAEARPCARVVLSAFQSVACASHAAWPKSILATGTSMGPHRSHESRAPSKWVTAANTRCPENDCEHSEHITRDVRDAVNRLFKKDPIDLVTPAEAMWSASLFPHPWCTAMRATQPHPRPHPLRHQGDDVPVTEFRDHCPKWRQRCSIPAIIEKAVPNSAETAAACRLMQFR